MDYQKELDNLITNLDYRPRLLLHSCCAPCSSYTLLYLSNYFDITVFYYNPNIDPYDEYLLRVREQKHFIQAINEEYGKNISFIDCDYDDNDYYNCIKEYTNEREGGKRCFLCYEYRLRKTAIFASLNGYDYFCTTLSISPYKNATWINEISSSLSKEYNIGYLPSDFKKRNGYKESIELSKKYKLYRQDYCGCKYSKRSTKDEE